MSDLTTTLRELHRIHTQLGDLRDRQERGPRMIRAREANLAKLEGDHAAVVAESKQARVTADQKNLLLKTGEAKIKDLQAKLNACKTNREYQALRDQIAADEMANSVLSDEILEALEKAEEYKAHIAEAANKVELSKQDLAKARESVASEAKLIQGDIERLEGILKTTEQNLPEDIRVQYDRIVRVKGADAMAAVEGDSCGGCYQKLTPNQANSLRLQTAIFCGSCGRLLYLAENTRIGR